MDKFRKHGFTFVKREFMLIILESWSFDELEQITAQYQDRFYSLDRANNNPKNYQQH